MRAAVLLALVALGGCVGDPGEEVAEAGDLGGGKADGASGTTRAFSLEAGAFPGSGHPDVVVYTPAGFDPTPPLDVVVFLHGWNNCAANVIRSVGAPCTPGRRARQAHGLAAQLEASGKNALLVVPELRFDAASGDPGALAEPGALAALLDETLAALALEPTVGRVIVVSHSGGYQAAAAFVRHGGVPITELHLLDSLYGHFDDFDAWVEDDHDGFAARDRRFASVYSRDGGTRVDSQAMATRAATWFAATPSAVRDDRTTATWTEADYDHGLLFKRTGLGHDAVPRYYFGRLLSTSALAASP